MTNIVLSRCRQPAPGSTRKIIEGFRVPDDRPPTENELARIEMLRAIVGDRDPPPTLAAVQALRRALMDR
ncbi:hypothetical protein [Rubellimicrobium arenae]|uniref:hypothetical protein n=1 Tax=Rubellimicrobium arenae TaxID=2817372 RepID=UPI001B307E0F|nr:hypothetical protein [Rubellimicrobium arenae]